MAQVLVPMIMLVVLVAGAMGASPPGNGNGNGKGGNNAKRARCMDKKYPRCYYTEHVCPNACPHACDVDCYTCKPVCSK